jgi:hypothetical protein
MLQLTTRIFSRMPSFDYLRSHSVYLQDDHIYYEVNLQYVVDIQLIDLVMA